MTLSQRLDLRLKGWMRRVEHSDLVPSCGHQLLEGVRIRERTPLLLQRKSSGYEIDLHSLHSTFYDD